MQLQRSRPLSEQAYLTLRRAILNGEIRPGERLTEASLCELLGASRTPVRESLRQLAWEGLLVVSRGGASVPLPDRATLLDLYHCRAALERWAVAQAAARASADDFADMEAYLNAAVEAGAADDLIGLLQANASFHDTIYRATGNKHLPDVIERVRGPLLLFRASASQGGANRERVRREHLAILAAIRNRDPIQAAARMDVHMLSDMEYITAQYQ